MSQSSELSKTKVYESKSESDRNKGEDIDCEQKVVSTISKKLKSKSSHGMCMYKGKSKKHPLSRKLQCVPAKGNLTSATTEVVLLEKNMEIKDLESRLKCFQNKIKKLENENKTLQDVQSRQERELNKYKQSVVDIPSLLKSHKEEIKAFQATVANSQREIRDCQKELKFRNDSLLKKEGQIDRLNNNLKQSKKLVSDFMSENKAYTAALQKLESENKVLTLENETLKSDHDSLNKNVKALQDKNESLEESLCNVRIFNTKLREELHVLQKKFGVEKLVVSTTKQIGDSAKEFSSMKDDSNKTLTECGERMKPGNLAVGEIDNETVPKGKLAVKKDALTSTFKCYQNLCSIQQVNSDVNEFETWKNFAYLPPIKTHSGKLSLAELYITDHEDRTHLFPPRCVDVAAKAKYFQDKELAERNKLFNNRTEISNSDDRVSGDSDIMNLGKPCFPDIPSTNSINNSQLLQTESYMTHSDERRLLFPPTTVDVKAKAKYFQNKELIERGNLVTNPTNNRNSKNKAGDGCEILKLEKSNSRENMETNKYNIDADINEKVSRTGKHGYKDAKELRKSGEILPENVTEAKGDYFRESVNVESKNEKTRKDCENRPRTINYAKDKPNLKKPFLQQPTKTHKDQDFTRSLGQNIKHPRSLLTSVDTWQSYF